MDKREVLPGFRSGMLEAVSEVPRRKGHKLWLCQCDCGAQTVVEESHLKTEHTKSCGCLRRKKGQQKAFNLYGHRFDRLTVVGPVSERFDGVPKWRCLCDCGKELYVEAEYLLRGKTRSCGCLQTDQRKVNMKKAIHFVDGTCIEKIACQRETASNTSGHRGVTRRQNGTWRAEITFRGKRYNLGTYKTFEEAVEARRQGEKRYYEEYLEQYYAMQNEGKEPQGIV